MAGADAGDQDVFEPVSANKAFIISTATDMNSAAIHGVKIEFCSVCTNLFLNRFIVCQHIPRRNSGAAERFLHQLRSFPGTSRRSERASVRSLARSHRARVLPCELVEPSPMR